MSLHIGGLGLMVKFTRGFSLSAVQLMPETDSLKTRRYYTALLIHFCFINSFSETPRIFAE